MRLSVNGKSYFILSLIVWLPFVASAQRSSSIYLNNGWTIQRSAMIAKTGEAISSQGFNVNTWYNASVPSTIMGALTQNGLYKDIFVGDNIKAIDKKQFEDSWWYRDEFDLKGTGKDQVITLHLDGVSYYANVWLNGKLIASKDVVFGAFRQFSFNITNTAKDGVNALAIEVFKRKPGDFGIGFVDWNPRPADESMGLWREVYISVTGPVSIEHPSIESKLSTSLDEAFLTLRTDVVNHTNQSVTGVLHGEINSTTFDFPVTLSPGEVKDLSLTEKEISSLHVSKPKLWWCSGLGDPNLYKLKLSYIENGKVSDSITTKFGIREVHDFVTKAGYRGYTLNGKKILIKGAGWTDDIFLRDTRASNEIQVQYVKHMNLNTIRLESVWGNNQSLYDLCDQHGILIMTGWTCQWEWENYLGKACGDFGGIQTEAEMNLMNESLNHQVKWLRSHPSIIAWFVGSDKLPKPELEKLYHKTLTTIDSRPYVTAASNMTSTISGTTGVKMNGPYEYVGPEYWYVDKAHGGAFGFNTETGPGPQIPVKETILKIIPKDKLWPINDVYDFHCTTAKEAFNKLDLFNDVVSGRFDRPANLDDYIKKSEVVQYEAMRAMFEAFHVNQANTTGIVQWMLNSAWPSFYWHLYDYYLIPTSAYYATRKANEPRQLMYNYADKSIYLVNELNEDQRQLKARIVLIGADGVKQYSEDIVCGAGALTSILIKKLPTIGNISFLSLELSDPNNNPIASNFYWLSSEKDGYDWENTTWAYTPMKSYANYKSLNSMAKAAIKPTLSKSTLKDGKVELALKLENAKTLAFFTQIQLKNADGQILKPVFWSDNYTSILPETSKTITCSVDKTLMTNGCYLEVTGWNIEPLRILVK